MQAGIYQSPKSNKVLSDKSYNFNLQDSGSVKNNNNNESKVVGKPNKPKGKFQQALKNKKDDMEFDVSCESYEKGKYGVWEFVFNINYYSKNYSNDPLVWRINKSFQDIKNFNAALEHELCSQVGFFQSVLR